MHPHASGRPDRDRVRAQRELGNEVGKPGGRVAAHLGDDAPDPRQEFGGQDRGRRTFRDELSVREHGDAVREPGREVEVVQRQDDRAPVTTGDPSDANEEVELVADVQVRRGFVQKEDRGLLGQYARQPGSLPFASAQLLDPATRKLGHVGIRERRGDRPDVRGPFGSERGNVGKATVADVVDEGDVVAGRLLLGHPRHDTGPFPEGKRAERSTEQMHGALGKRFETRDGPEKTGLARPVGPGQGEHFAPGNRQADRPDRDLVAVSDRGGLDAQRWGEVPTHELGLPPVPRPCRR